MVKSFQAIPFSKSRTEGVIVERIDPLVDGKWDELVSNNTNSSVFHYSAWARVLAETYGHQPFYFRISVHGVEVALVPLMEVKSLFTGCRGISLPFSDFAGPLWRDSSYASSVYAALLEFATSRKWRYLEVRGDLIPPKHANPFQAYVSHKIDLRHGTEVLFRNLDPSVRRAIRKSESSGLEVTTGYNVEAMNDFYSLHGKTRRRHGLPPQPFEFFQSISKHFLERKLGSIILAKLSGVPVAGAVFLYSAGRAVYKFGASNIDHWPLRPNHGIMWTAICELVKNNCEELNFGRTSPADSGLNRFKSSWGSVPQSLSYFRYSSRSDAWVTANQFPKESFPLVFGHLPLALNRLAGRLIYPHLE